MRRSTLVLSVAALALVPACSLSGLDRLDRAQCSDDAFCESLNYGDSGVMSADDCLTWQCNRTTSFCELMPRDDDGDDVPAAGMCVDPGETTDCDDADGSNYPGNTEVCNGVDDNCDDLADEGGVIVAADALNTHPFTATSSVPRFAPSFDTDEVLVLHGDRDSMGRAVLQADVTPAGDAAMLDDLAISLSAPGFAIVLPSETVAAPLAHERWALGLVTTATSSGTACPHVSVVEYAQGARSLMLTADMAGIGLTKPAGSCPADLSPVATPAIATTMRRVVAAWVSDTAAATRDCETATASDLVLSSAGLPAGGTATIGSALVAGQSADPSAPTLLPIAAGELLLAYVDGTGAVVVQRVSVAADLTMMVSPLFSVPGDGMRRGDVTVALGAADGTTQRAVLAWRSGCAAQTELHARLLSIDTGAWTASATAMLDSIGSGANRRDLSVAYQPRSSEWMVVYRQGTARLSAARFDTALAPIGDPVDVASGRTALTRPTAVRPLAEGAALWGVMAYDDDPSAVLGARIGCAP